MAHHSLYWSVKAFISPVCFLIPAPDSFEKYVYISYNKSGKF